MKTILPKPLLAASASVLLALAAVPSAQADYPGTVMSLNPVGYWRLNEPAGTSINYGTGKATNSSALGTAVNGTYYYSPILGQPGPVAGQTCVQLNAATNNQYIDVPYSPVIQTNGPFSVEFWAMQTNSAGAAKSGVMAYSGSSGYLFYTDNGVPQWTFRIWYGTNGVPSGTRLYFGGHGANNVLGTWVHVVGVCDGSAAHLYINGADNEGPQPFPAGTIYAPNTSAPLRIGANNPGGSPGIPFPGFMAQVATYPYALTLSQAAAHYAAATTNAAGYSAQILADRPSGYWRLNEPGPLPPPPTGVTVTVANLGSWGPGANGLLNVVPPFNTGVPGVPYPPFGTNTACYFAGTGCRIQVPPQNLSTDSFTITCWTKLTNTMQLPWTRLFDSPSADGASHTGPGFSNGGSPGMANNQLGLWLSGAIKGSGGFGNGTTPPAYEPLGQWTFFAMVASTSNTVLYVNELATTSTALNTTAYGPHDFSLANIFIGPDMVGLLSDVALFDHALTPVEIAQLYAAAGVPAVPTTLTITHPDGSGNFTLSGTTVPGRTVKLWKSTDLNLGAGGWAEAGAINGDAITGIWSFPLTQGMDAHAFYQVKNQ